MQDTLIILFCLVDDFCNLFLKEWDKHLISDGLKKRHKPSTLRVSDIITIYIHFHQSHYRDFKAYYLNYVCPHLRWAFPSLVSYNRFVELIKSILVPLCFFMQSLSGEQTGLYFIDPTVIKVCHIKREKQHRVFEGMAKKSRSWIGWFFGFKLHLVINDKGEIMAFKLTAANVDDRQPVPHLVKDFIGKLIADKGYIGQKLFDTLYEQGLQLVTGIKKNMKITMCSICI